MLPVLSSLWFVIFLKMVQAQDGLQLTNIQDFCDAFEIDDFNCTCTNSEIREALIVFPKVCEKTDALSGRGGNTPIEYDTRYQRIYAGVVIVVSAFGIAGNILVIIVTLKNRKTAITYQKLIGQLAFWDLTFAILQSATVVQLFWTNTWEYGEGMCKLLHSSLTLGALLAVGLILIITLERYLAIVHPFVWRNGTKNLGYILSIINTVAAIASVVPRIMYLHLTNDSECVEKWPLHRSELIYHVYLMAVYFALPVIAIFILHLHIMYTLRNGRFTTQSQLDVRVKHMNQRIMYVLISVVIAFVILVFPNRSVMLYFAYVEYQVDGDLYTVLVFIAMLPYSFHVAVNPILYSAVDKAWRKQTIGIIKQTFLRSIKVKRKNTMSTNESHGYTLEVKLRTHSVKETIHKSRMESPLLHRHMECLDTAPTSNSQPLESISHRELPKSWMEDDSDLKLRCAIIHANGWEKETIL